MSVNEEAINDEEEAPPRPRTMRTNTAPPPPPVDAPEAQDADDEESEGYVSPLRGGWTEGQKVMDSTSGFAQRFKPDNDTVIVKFLDDTPYVNFRQHWIERMGQQGVKKRPYLCLETVDKNCPLCNIGDKPNAVAAFNILVVGDDGQVMLKSWDAGVRVFGSLKNYNNDPKMGPLTKNYWAVSKSGTGSSTVHNINMIRERDLTEDYGIPVPSPEDVKRAGKYGPDIITIPKKSELQEVADEIADLD